MILSPRLSKLALPITLPLDSSKRNAASPSSFLGSLGWLVDPASFGRAAFSKGSRPGTVQENHCRDSVRRPLVSFGFGFGWAEVVL